jgi:hypothetical protein
VLACSREPRLCIPLLFGLGPLLELFELEPALLPPPFEAVIPRAACAALAAAPVSGWPSGPHGTPLMI